MIGENKNDDTVEKVPIWHKITLSIKEASLYTGIGITKMQQITKDSKCPFVLYVGGKRLVKRKELEKFIEKSLEI